MAKREAAQAAQKAEEEAAGSKEGKAGEDGGVVVRQFRRVGR